MSADAIAIRPLERSDHAAWLPLWRGYQAFYRVDIADAVSDVTWQRLLDPAEPMGGALAWQGNRRSVSFTTSDTAPAGRWATIVICRISMWMARFAAPASVAADRACLSCRGGPGLFAGALADT